MQCNRDHADDKEYGHYTDKDSNGITNANDNNNSNHIINPQIHNRMYTRDADNIHEATK